MTLEQFREQVKPLMEDGDHWAVCLEIDTMRDGRVVPEWSVYLTGAPMYSKTITADTPEKCIKKLREYLGE